MPIPGGVFNSWAFMTCMECLDSMMLNIDAEVLACTTSAMLIQIRADLWHYAWGKVRYAEWVWSFNVGVVVWMGGVVDDLCVM